MAAVADRPCDLFASSPPLVPAPPPRAMLHDPYEGISLTVDAQEWHRLDVDRALMWTRVRVLSNQASFAISRPCGRAHAHLSNVWTRCVSPPCLCGVCARPLKMSLCPARMCSRVRKFDDQNFPPRAILGSLDRFSIMHANNKKEQSTNKRRVEARRGYTPMRQSTAPQARERVTLSHNTGHGTREAQEKKKDTRDQMAVKTWP